MMKVQSFVENEEGFFSRQKFFEVQKVLGLRPVITLSFLPLSY